MFMDTKLIAILACAAALALGACSGNNASGTTGEGGDQTGGGPDTDGNGGSNGDGEPTPLRTAETRYSDAQGAATRAVEAARLAATAGTEAARANAQRLIGLASTALDDAVEAAEAAVAAAVDGSAVQIGAAARARSLALRLRTARAQDLEDARDSLAWYGKKLARYVLASGEAVTPRESTNEAVIVRIPRTIDTSATDSTQKRNPKAFCEKSREPATCDEDTFKTVMYEDGKKVFSTADDGEGGDEFKVDGWVGWPETDWRLEAFIHTGLKLTDAGLVIRTGGTITIPGWPSQIFIVDYADMRRNLANYANQGGTGHNGWDLEITFDAPQNMPVPNAPDGENWVSSWQGNGDFYWRAIAPADEDMQLAADGKYYQEGAFLQPDGYKDLGTYEIWLSNHIGVDTKLEPPPGQEGTCRDGSRRTACPEDDEQYYLDYAAYGLFVLTADTETFRAGYNGHASRVNTLHFGYSAFADADGQRTTDIGTAITSGKFYGSTLAYEVQGGRTTTINTKLLRGDVVLTVNIPKGTGAGTLRGTMRNFQRWDEEGGYWTAYADRLAVTVNSTAISADGTFSGRVAATPSNEWSSNGQGLLKGSFYGPRADSDDLEIAGSYTVGQSFVPHAVAQGAGFTNLGAQSRKGVFGSFAAKQRPDAIPPSN